MRRSEFIDKLRRAVKELSDTGRFNDGTVAVPIVQEYGIFLDGGHYHASTNPVVLAAMALAGPQPTGDDVDKQLYISQRAEEAWEYFDDQQQKKAAAETPHFVLESRSIGPHADPR